MGVRRAGSTRAGERRRSAARRADTPAQQGRRAAVGPSLPPVRGLLRGRRKLLLRLLPRAMRRLDGRGRGRGRKVVLVASPSPLRRTEPDWHDGARSPGALSPPSRLSHLLEATRVSSPVWWSAAQDRERARALGSGGGYSSALRYDEDDDEDERALALAWRPVPLVKTRSAPARLEEDGTPVFEDDDESQRGGAHGWACRGCGESDTRKLTVNRDGAMTCDSCGVVEGQVHVALDRQKNCARRDDKTVVADLPSTRDSEAERFATGEVETAEQARKRHVLALGGTRIAQQTSKKCDLGGAHSRAQTAALNAARARGEIDQASEKKLRPVLHVVEATLDQVGPVHRDVQKFIRMEAARVVRAGVFHAKRCAECRVNIAGRSNKLLGICFVEASLERLLSDGRAGSSPVAPDCSAQQLELCLQRTRDLQLRSASAGPAARAQTAAAIAMAAQWTDAQIGRPCGGGSPVPSGGGGGGGASPVSPLALPSPLLPPALVEGALVEGALSPLSPRSAPRSPTAPGVSIFNVRDQILAAAREARPTAQVRCAALAAIQEPAVAAWLATEGSLPADVVGVAVLVAAARRIGADAASAVALQRRLCFQHDLSPTTAETAAESVAALLPPVAPPASTAVADSIF